MKSSSLPQSSTLFPVDGQLLMVLPRAGASLKNPDMQLPVLRSDTDGHYLELRVVEDPNDHREVAITRRVPLDNLSAEEWEELQAEYINVNWQDCVHRGLSKGLEKIQDRRIQRLFMALLTFLNPRQVSIIFYLYKLAAEQGNGPIVSFRSNDLLASLGYTRTRDGGYAAKLRSQLHRDLVALHRTELVIAQSLRKGNQIGAKVTIKSILRIQDYEIDQVPRNFDLAIAADYTYELADAYTLSLEFFDGPSRSGDNVFLPRQLDISQKLGGQTKSDYRTKLLVYLASRLKWDNPTGGQYLVVAKSYLFKNLDLFGSNASRNNQIFWRTVEQLTQEGYLVSAQELPGKKQATTIQFQLNPDRLWTSSAVK